VQADGRRAGGLLTARYVTPFSIPPVSRVPCQYNTSYSNFELSPLSHRSTVTLLPSLKNIYLQRSLSVDPVACLSVRTAGGEGGWKTPCLRLAEGRPTWIDRISRPSSDMLHAFVCMHACIHAMRCMYGRAHYIQHALRCSQALPAGMEMHVWKSEVDIFYSSSPESYSSGLGATLVRGWISCRISAKSHLYPSADGSEALSSA
jgi:hypothetical protein